MEYVYWIICMMVFMCYSEVLSKYNLKGKEHFWKYLQIRNCVMSLDRQTEDNHILEYLVLPPHHHRASIFYRQMNSALSTDLKNLKVLWERDFGVVFGNEEWMKIISQCQKFLRESKGKFTQYKIVQRYYWTPVRLNRLGHCVKMSKC